MDYTIIHEVPGRIRLGLGGTLPAQDVDPLIAALSSGAAVTKVVVYPRIGSVALEYPLGSCNRQRVLDLVSALTAEDIDAARATYSTALAPTTGNLLMDIAELVGFHLARRWLLPAPLAALWAVWRYRHFVRAAARSLARGSLEVPVLDAVAIGISFLRRDPRTAASTMFLLDLGETLEEYTRVRSENELIYSLLAAPQTARRIVDGEEVPANAGDLAPGDLVVIRTGMPVPADGTVERGRAMVNQSALTGEPLAVERAEGDDLFSGTAVEEGEVFLRVRASARETRLRSIVSLVEQSETLKAEAQSRRERLADRIVPWNFLLAALVALSTRSLVKTSTALMVDYSCALKLTGSIAALSAMSQSARKGFTVKGSKHFEAMATADTIVFDKTGTLTAAEPSVETVLPLAPGWTENDVLRISACLEEHFPHPVARAVVNAAARRGLEHREQHAEVEYLVAHGIASSLGGKRLVIGSRHFVIEDEHVPVAAEVDARIQGAFEGLSTLYLADGGALVGVIGIKDPLKPHVAEAVDSLRGLGFERIVMLTGDNERTAARIAAEAGIAEYRADLLPEGKHAFVERLVQEGRRVVMVGDGVNDSPALSAAHVGIAMGTGTAIAKEVADITLADGDLGSIVELRRLSRSLMRRLDTSFAQIVGINSALLAGGIGGVIAPRTSALLHNGSTVALALNAARAYS